MDPCVIEVNNTDYYYPCDRKEDIYYDETNGYLTNVSSSSITLYGSIAEYSNSSSGYPRITIPSYTKAYYRSSYSATQTTLNVTSLEFKNSHYEMSVLLLITILGVLLCQFFKR